MNPNRRQFIAMTTAGLVATPAAMAQSTKPNFIIIFADDLGYGDISGFGYQKSPFETPNLDRMANEGVKLTHVYVPVPYCAPSRASLLTGRYPFRTGMVHNPSPDSGSDNIALSQSEITIAEALKPAGYATSCIGKWHLGHKLENLPRTQGFDEYFGILYSNDMRPVQLIENEKVVEYPVVQATLTKRYTERAVDFIERSHQQNKPFFLYLPHAMPHKPLAASDDFYTPKTPDDLYADVVRELDWSVGRILDKLKSLGIDENTFVIFTSDNGPWYGGSTGGLRGMKAKTFDGGLRVPFIARWPKKIPAQQVNSSLASSVDVFPTLLKAAGVDLPGDRTLDGKSLWPLLESEKAPSQHEAIVGMRGTDLAIVRSGKWKLHVNNPGGVPNRGDNWVDPRGPDGVSLLAPYEQARPKDYPGVIGGAEPKSMMLFNIEEDHAEQHDVSGQHPDIVKRLKKIADDYLAQFPLSFTTPDRYGEIRYIKGGAIDFYKR